jgi:hypothetical protein
MVVHIRRESKDSAIKAQFGLNGATYIFCAAKAVLLAGEKQVRDRDAARAQRFDEAFGLIGRHGERLRYKSRAPG